GVNLLAVEIHGEAAVQTDQGAGDTGQRHQISARPDGAELLHVRGHSGVEKGLDTPEELEPDAGRAVQVGVDTDEHCRAHGGYRQPATGPCPEEPDEVVLQFGRFLRGDEHVGHAAEAARHAVDELAAFDGVGNIVGGRADPREDFSAIGETDLGAVAGYAG